MNDNRLRFLLAPLVAAALVFSAAACGSDDDAGSDATIAETTQATQATRASEMASGTTLAADMGDDTTAMPGGEATVGDITVTDAWVRQPAEGQTTSAAYATIVNDGDTDVTLVGASVSIDATVELHETLMGDDGTMQMQEREDGFAIPAGEQFVLEPGGPHVMMLDIDPADFGGDIDVTLVFDDGTEVTVTAPVRSLDGMDTAGDDMGDMTETTDG